MRPYTLVYRYQGFRGAFYLPLLKTETASSSHMLVRIYQITQHNLTFRGLCIVIYSYNKTNEMP